MITINTLPSIKIEEKINFKRIKHLHTGLQALKYARKMPRTSYVEIKRYGKDDSFDLKITIPGSKNRLKMNKSPENYKLDERSIPYINVNNNMYENSHNNPKWITYWKRKELRDWHIIPRHVLSKIQFSSLNTYVSGVDILYKSFWLARLRTPKFINWEYKNQHAASNFKHVIQVKQIKKIVEEPFDLIPRDTKLTVKGWESFPGIKPKIVYTYFYLIFTEPQHFKGASTIAEIYQFNEDEKDTLYTEDLDIKVKKFKSYSTKNIEAFFDETEKNKRYKIDNNNNFAKYVGAIKTKNNFYYDYIKKKVVEGYGPNNVVGDFIPYNFKGNYRWDIQLRLNEVFDNLQLSLMKTIQNPLLDPNGGNIVLKIDRRIENINELPKHTLDNQTLKIIRDFPEITYKGILQRSILTADIHE